MWRQGETLWEDGGLEGCICESRNAEGCWQTTRSQEDKRASPTGSEGVCHVDNLVLHFQPPELWDNNFLFFLSAQFVVVSHGSPRKWTHSPFAIPRQPPERTFNGSTAREIKSDVPRNMAWKTLQDLALYPHPELDFLPFCKVTNIKPLLILLTDFPLGVICRILAWDVFPKGPICSVNASSLNAKLTQLKDDRMEMSKVHMKRPPP